MEIDYDADDEKGSDVEMAEESLDENIELMSKKIMKIKIENNTHK